jgi:hypothetical protein
LAVQKADLRAINHISQIWGRDDLTDDIAGKTMAYIKNLPHDRSDATSEEPHQTCLYETFETFVGDHDWANKARKALSDGDCKVSFTVSFLKST